MPIQVKGLQAFRWIPDVQEYVQDSSTHHTALFKKQKHISRMQLSTEHLLIHRTGSTSCSVAFCTLVLTVMLCMSSEMYNSHGKCFLCNQPNNGSDQSTLTIWDSLCLMDFYCHCRVKNVPWCSPTWLVWSFNVTNENECLLWLSVP